MAENNFKSCLEIFKSCLTAQKSSLKNSDYYIFFYIFAHNNQT